MPNPNEVPPLQPSATADSMYSDESIPNLSTGVEDRYRVADPLHPVLELIIAVFVWIASLLVQAIVPVFVIVPFAIYRGLDPSSPDFARATLELAVTDRTALFLQVLSIFPTHLITFAIVWAFVTRLRKRPFFSSLGWGWAGRLRLWQSIALGIVLFAAATALAKFLGAEKPTQLEQLINSSMGARYAIAALAVFTAPFIEEFIYRGVLYSALERTIGVNGAVILVLGLFTLIHVPQYWPNIGVISAVAMLSIVLTIIRAYTGRLLPCVVIHMAFNAVQAVLLVLEPYVQNVLPRPEPTVPTLSVLGNLVSHIF